jgi:hypothetical protein
MVSQKIRQVRKAKLFNYIFVLKLKQKWILGQAKNITEQNNLKSLNLAWS